MRWRDLFYHPERVADRVAEMLDILEELHPLPPPRMSTAYGREARLEEWLHMFGSLLNPVEYCTIHDALFLDHPL